MTGFDITELNKMIQQLEQVGANINGITEQVLDEASEPAKQTFYNSCVQAFNRYTPAPLSSLDNIEVGPTKTSKRKSRFRLVGALAREFEYLYYVEYGHSNAPPHPFLERAYRDTRDLVGPLMENAFVRAYENYMKG